MCNVEPPLEFTDQEKALIEAAKSEAGSTWSSSTIGDVKSRIKQFYRDNIIDECCYCRCSFHGEFKLVIDIEHILPKSEYEELMFSPVNLSLACKRCNMGIKKADTLFVTNTIAAKNTPFESHLYLFIHPNLDSYYDHIDKLSFELNGVRVTKYVTKNHSSKGEYTYKYFRLEELEINDLDIAQGRASGAKLSEQISEEMQDRLANVISEIN